MRLINKAYHEVIKLLMLQNIRARQSDLLVELSTDIGL